jgi:hypothetical protein
MFLGLICEYARATDRFPEGSYSVYESYLTQRFARDAERVQKRYKVSAELVRTLAEEIAFSMSAIPGLGLSPTRQALHSALIKTDYIPIARLDAVLDALEYVKLGRAAEDAEGSGQPSFTFAHRRFQEYFATRVVIRNPERVSETELLTDGRWRETAVTIMQTQPVTAVATLLEEATRLLAPMTRKALEDEESQAVNGGYCWPSGSMHLLGMLNAGLGQVPDNIPDKFRADAGSLLLSAWNKGRRYDKKWAIGLALVASNDEAILLLEQAFAAGSIVLGGEAYACVSRMTDPPPNLYEGVRKTLVDMAASGDLTDQKVALNAQVRRLPDPGPLIQTLRLLIMAPRIDYGLAAIQVLICAVIFWPFSILEILFVTGALAGYRQMLLTQVPYQIRGTNFIIRPYSPIVWPIIILARTFAAILTVGVAFGFPPRNTLIVVTACIAGTYFACWPLAVGYVCKHWRRANEFLWPLIPLFALMGAVRRFMIAVKEMPKPILWGGLLVSLVYAAAISVSLKYLVTLAKNPAFTRIVVIIGASASILIIIAGSYFVVVNLNRRRNDTRLIRSIAAKQQFTIAEAFNILDRIGTPRGVRLFIESLLQIDLVAHPEILRMLSDIAATAEVSLEETATQEKDNEAIVVPGVTSEFADWLKASHAETRISLILRRLLRRKRPAMPYAIRNVQKPMLDQIARTIEQIEMARGFAVL